MLERAHRVALSLLPSLAIVALVAACAAQSASEPPTSTGAAPAAPSATAGPVSAGPSVPTACMGLGLVDCTTVLDAALAVAASSRAPIYAQVGPFGCSVDPLCPRTLAARPEGDVTLDLPNGTQTTIHIKADADGSLTPTQGEAFGIPVEPSSGRAGPGPVPYRLGHCGMYSGIDVDGSYWDPVGLVDPDHADAINAADGTFTFTGPDQGLFVSKGGWQVQLIRHQGPKHLPGCM